MSSGSALLLIDALREQLSSLTSDQSIVSSSLPSALHEMGIHHLSEFEAGQVLQRRLDLTVC